MKSAHRYSDRYAWDTATPRKSRDCWASANGNTDAVRSSGQTRKAKSAPSDGTKSASNGTDLRDL